MQKNFTQNDVFAGSLHNESPVMAGLKAVQEWFFLLLLITVGAIGFFYVMSNSNGTSQSFKAKYKTEQVSKAGFFVGN
ncbi:MAG: hypothetical protein R2879_14210 [Saprospiraceae bacterium]